jgi:hypothetical protein
MRFRDYWFHTDVLQDFLVLYLLIPCTYVRSMSLGLIPRSGASNNSLNIVSRLTILGCRRPPPLNFLFIYFLQIYWKNAIFQCKKGIIHSHRDLNSVSSSTDKTNLLGPIPSRLRSPGPRVSIRVAVSSDGGNTSLRLKPVVPTRFVSVSRWDCRNKSLTNSLCIKPPRHTCNYESINRE